MAKPKVIIIGGGFGGLRAAKKLKKADMDVLLIDKMNHHLFQPLLYQVATAALSPADIASPIREELRKQQNTEVIMGEVIDIDPDQKTVKLKNEDVFPFDYLIVATGARHSYFGHDEWEQFAPGIKTLADAIRIREEVLIAFEKAERCDDREEAQKHMRFLIIGGGPTGVELAGAIAEIARKTMFKNFRKIHPEQAEVILIEGAPHILNAYPDRLAWKGRKELESLGVNIWTNTHVTGVEKNGIWIGKTFIESSNVIWAAGNAVSPMLKSLKSETDRAGRVLVDNDLSVPKHPNVFVIGDSAHFVAKNGKMLPGLATVAIQEGSYVGKLIRDQVPKEKRKPFKYFDKGTMATIGRSKAIVHLHKLKFTGFFAWLTWCFVHIFYLIGFRNRFSVFMQWFWLYFFGKRNARLIVRRVYEDNEEMPRRHHAE